MSNPESLIVWVVGLPLLAAVVTAVLGPWLLGRWSHLPTVICLAAACGCSLVLLNHVLSEPAPNEISGEAEISREQAENQYEVLIPLWTWAVVPEGGDRASLDPATVEPGPADSTVVVPSQDFSIEIELRLDGLTAMMLSMVTFISLFVAIFSIGYMHGDGGYWRFFSYLPLFVFSMTMLVSVSNYLLLYVFWEAVGVCSYLLIGFWYTKPAAAAAAKKAFLVNRVGDFGLALGVFFIWTTFHTLDFHDSAAGLGVFSQISGMPAFAGSALATTICLLLLVGACGKSAQFPLHVWLPDAMEGPTPASALIHAATMVTAGVYLIARSTPLFMASPDAQLVVAGIGAITALMAAIIALTQYDLKRVLAYSTISQLGYMFMGLGAGTLAGISGGMFHLFTHAFFKALLFMGAGSVMHAMGNVIDMRRFGGLRKLMPITHATFLVGCLALSGLAPFAGFWSKDAVIGSLHDRIHDYQHLAGAEEGHGVDEGHGDDRGEGDHTTHAAVTPGFEVSQAGAARQVWGLSLVYWGAMITAMLTAFYTFRAFFMTFYGEELVPAEAGHHAHESPPVMWVPLAVLSLGVLIISGACLLSWSIPDWLGAFTQLLGRSPSLAALAASAGEPTFHWGVTLWSTGLVLGGIALAMYLYLGHHREVATARDVIDFRWLRADMALRVTAWVAALPLTSAAGRGLGKIGLGWLAELARFVLLVVLTIVLAPLWLGYVLSPYRLSQHKFYFDEIYDWVVVKPIRGFGRICATLDRLLIDGLVDFVGRLPVRLGGWLRNLQVGLLSFYALAMLLGVLALVFVRAWWP